MVSAQIPAEQGVGLVVEGHPVVLAGQLVVLAAGAPQEAVAGLRSLRHTWRNITSRYIWHIWWICTPIIEPLIFWRNVVLTRVLTPNACVARTSVVWTVWKHILIKQRHH